MEISHIYCSSTVLFEQQCIISNHHLAKDIAYDQENLFPPAILNLKLLIFKRLNSYVNQLHVDDFQDAEPRVSPLETTSLGHTVSEIIGIYILKISYNSAEWA